MKKVPQRKWMSLWRHFFHREKTGEQLTETMIEWQEKYRWDLLKINPPACYHVLDWGATYEFYDDEFREPQQVRPVVVSEKDIERIGRPDPTRGMLGEQLQVIRNLRAHFGPELPILETVFSPLEIAHRLMKDRESMLRLIRTAPDSVHSLLQQIQEVFLEFIQKCLEAGADGIFFATKWASHDFLSWAEYEIFGKQYELPVLQSLVKQDALILLHICGDRSHLSKMLDYPADIFSYDFFADGALPPESIIRKTGKFVMGGIHPQRIATDLQGVIRDCSRYATLDGWLIGPSCVVPPGIPPETLAALKAELCSVR